MAAGTSGETARPADRTVVYLVRHGQTPLNESGVLRGCFNTLELRSGQWAVLSVNELPAQ